MLFPIVPMRALVCALLISATAALTPVHAAVIVDAASFSQANDSGGGFTVATSQFSLTSADIPDATFEANFSIIDAGIEVLVNGTSLFNTGDDLSQFGPQVFQITAVQPDNIDSPFGPNSNGLPRLTVDSDATGSTFTGAVFQNSTNVDNYNPLFNVINFTSLLQPGNNVIEIVNLNSFEGANLVGDYTVEIVAEAVPEPTALALLLAGGLGWMTRRRRV